MVGTLKDQKLYNFEEGVELGGENSTRMVIDSWLKFKNRPLTADMLTSQLDLPRPIDSRYFFFLF